MKAGSLKKVFAGILAGAMVLGSAVTAGAAVVWNEAETLTGTEWWGGMQRGTDYTMSGDGTWQFSVKANALDDNGYGAFSVEIYDGGKNGYITTGSDKNIWVAEGYSEGGTVSGAASEFASELTAGNVYIVMITRAGDDFTFTYADQTAGTDIITMKANAPASESVVAHVMAQVGTYEVKFGTVEKEAAPDDTTEGETSDDSAAAGDESAKTGESAPIAFYVMIGAACSLLLIGGKKRLAK